MKGMDDLDKMMEAQFQRRYGRQPLTKCRDCKHAVSKRASQCPHCGSQAFDVPSLLHYVGKQLLWLALMLLIGSSSVAYLLSLRN